jgi:hypothetical protein
MLDSRQHYLKNNCKYFIQFSVRGALCFPFKNATINIFYSCVNKKIMSVPVSFPAIFPYLGPRACPTVDTLEHGSF